VGVLTNEEQALGLQQPAGIGQRPRPMSAETVVSSGGSRQGSWEASTDQSDNSGGNGDGVSVGGASGSQHAPQESRQKRNCMYYVHVLFVLH